MTLHVAVNAYNIEIFQAIVRRLCILYPVNRLYEKRNTVSIFLAEMLVYVINPSTLSSFCTL